jgi:hypothetical protein
VTAEVPWRSHQAASVTTPGQLATPLEDATVDICSGVTA